MIHTWSVSVLLVLLVALAGCVGGGVPDAPTGGTGGDGGDGGSDGGDLDVTEPERVLREAGSFTSTWSFAMVDADGVESRISNAFAVDLAANRTSESLSLAGDEAGVSYERFTADGTSYTRYGDGGETFYQVIPVQDDPVTDALSWGAALSYDDLTDAERVGSETFDGMTVDRYEYADRTLWRQYGATTFGTAENVTVTEFTVVVLVDRDGLARSTGWTLVGETDAGETVTAEWRFDLTGVGSTTVLDPDWLAEARAAGSSPSG